MNQKLITEEVYRRAIAEAAALRDHRLNSRDKTVWWATTHRMLTKHPAAGTDCGGVRRGLAMRHGRRRRGRPAPGKPGLLKTGRHD